MLLPEKREDSVSFPSPLSLSFSLSLEVWRLAKKSTILIPELPNAPSVALFRRREAEIRRQKKKVKIMMDGFP